MALVAVRCPRCGSDEIIKPIGFSTSMAMHDTVIGLFINRDEFGQAVSRLDLPV